MCLHAYDIFGNVTYALLPDGNENYFEYDYNGNCLNEINGAGEEILYSYDGLNRLTKQETTNGEERSIHRSYYNFRNNLEVSLDAENNKTEYSYNLRGFLTNVRQYSNGTSGQETEYSYDGEGNISSFATGAIGDNNKHIYQYELDTLGRCIKETDPMGSIIQYAYETDGNLSQSIDKNGVVTDYTYDGLGRLIQESNSKGQNLCYTYNGFDEVTGITDGKLTVKTSYNKFGETVKITRDRNEENFTYDIAGRVINHTISDLDIGTLTTRYTYDTLGRTTAIETDGGSEYISYDKAGRISEKNYPQTGVRKVYTYYKDSTLKSLLTYVDGKLTTTENIEYDRNGNKTLWEQDDKVTSYTYDGMNRLQGVKESNGVLTEYEFDSFGNISREYILSSSGIKTTQYEYDRNNRLLISFDDKSSTRYSYDKNGNLINKIYELSGRETESYYSYDGYNRLSEYISGNTSAEYSYNPEGLRESKTVNGKYTRFIYDGANIVGELTDDNYYIYYRGTELLGMNSYDNNSYYYRLDSHGNVTDLLTHTGDEIKSYTYNPYGKEKPFSINPAGNETILYHWKNETENTHNPFRYCGEYYDEESGLIYLRNRYYDPSIGRFISEDPVRDGLNWYVYCRNNPVNYVDPWGLKSYIFYTTGEDSDFTKQAMWKKEQLENTGEDVVMKKINSLEAFENAWSSLGGDNDEKVDSLYIYSHGNERTLILEDGTYNNALSIDGKNSLGDKIGNLNELEPKRIEELHLYSCNAGHIVTYYGKNKNLASVLSKKVIGGVVYAYDGNISFGKSWVLEPLRNSFEDRLSLNQDSFYKIARKIKGENAYLCSLEPKGKVVYQNGAYLPYGRSSIQNKYK